MRWLKLALYAQLMFGLAALLSAAGHIERLAGPPGAWAITVASSPGSGNRIYAGLHGAGVLRSTDGGKTWTEINQGLQERTVNPIAFDPINPDVMYVGTENGLFKSRDGGSHWTEADAGLTTRNIWSLSVDPVNHARLYAGTSGGGVFRSDDEGKTWKPASTGITNRAVWPVLASSAAVYAGTLGSGLFRSVDHGGTWHPVNNGLTNLRIMAIAIDPGSRNRIYVGTAAGIFSSADAGDTWTLLCPQLETQLVFALQTMLRDKQTVLWAGTGSGVFVSRDGGKTWTQPVLGDSSAPVWSIALQGKRIFAGTLGRGILETEDGVTWRVALAGKAHQLIYSLAHDGRYLYAGTIGAGVWKSPDEGRSWMFANKGLTKRVVKTLVIDPHHKDVLYAGAEDQFMGGTGAVFRSMDGGDNWSDLTKNAFPRRVFSLAIDANTIYAGTDQGGVYVSSDQGGSWRQIDHGKLIDSVTGATLYQQAIHRRPVFALVVDPYMSNVIYAATDGGIFKSTDRGQTWKNSSNGLDDRRVRVLLIDPKKPTVLFAGCGDLGAGGALFKTENAGSTWKKLSIGSYWVLSLALDPENDKVLYVGTERGLFVTRDSGGTWTLIDDGPRSKYILSLALNPLHSGTIFAGTEGNGIFAVRLGTFQ